MGRGCWEFMGYRGAQGLGFSSTHIHSPGTRTAGGVGSRNTYGYGDSDNSNNNKRLLCSMTLLEGQPILVRGQSMEQGLEPVLEMPEGGGEIPVGSHSSPCSPLHGCRGEAPENVALAGNLS